MAKAIPRVTRVTIVESRRNPFSTASLVCSFVALPWLIALYVEFAAIVPSMLGIVFGVVGQVQIRRSNGGERGLRVSAAGIAIGALAAALAVIFTLELAAAL
jgi:hypothetical protein